jgi:hypothetical protein
VNPTTHRQAHAAHIPFCSRSPAAPPILTVRVTGKNGTNPEISDIGTRQT